MGDSLCLSRARPSSTAVASRALRRHRPLPRLSLLYLAAVGALPGAAQAQMTFDFSTGWTSVGANVTYQTTPFTTLSKGTAFTLNAPTGLGMYRLSPVTSAVNGASAADAALGLTTGTVDALLNHNPNFAGSVTNFSVLTQTMTLNAGTYSFAWALNVTDPGFNDGAIFSVSGNGLQYLESLARAGGPGDTTGPSPNTYVAYAFDPANGVTPWLTTTFNIATTGTYKVSFADYNWGDLAVPPNFFVASTIGTYTGNPLAGTNAPPATPDITSGTVTGSDLVNGTVNPVFDGGTLRADVANAVYSANLAIKGTGGTIDQNGLSSTFSGVLSDQTPGTPGAMSFVNAGASGGSVTLTGVNTYTGQTTVGNGATLALAGAGSIASSSRLVNNGVFDIAGTSAGASLTSLAGTGTVALGGQVLTLTAAADTFGGVIGGSGGVTVAGGTQTLSGLNTFTGATSIASGATLALSGTGSIAASSGLANDGGFDISGTTSGATLTSLTGGGTVALGAQTLTLSNASGAFAGAIGGSGGLTIDGGTQTLSGLNTFTGATSIASGATLALSGTGSIAASSGLANDGGFDISGTTTGATLTSLTGGGTVALGAQTLTLSNASGAFAGAIGGSGGLTVAGGTQTLSGLNTFTGATSIASGATLALSGTGGVAASSGLANNGLFDISGTTAGATVTRLTGGGTVVLGAQTLTLSDAGGVYAGSIAGSGGLAIAGGAQTLSSANGFTGATSVASGATLALTGAGSIAASSGLANNGSFDISATTSGTTLMGLTGGGSVVLGSRTLTVANASGGYAGTIGGSGGLAVVGGTQALSGINGFTGATSIGGGATLALTGAGSVAASSGVTNDGTLDISGTSTGTSVRTLAGAGNVVLGGKTLTIDTTAASFSGAISGSGGVRLNGGQWTVGNAQTYTGLTLLAASSLRVNGSLAGGVDVGSGAMLQGSGTIAGPVTVAPGGKLSPGNSPGVMTVGASVSLAPGSTFDVDINGATPGNGAGHHDQLVLTGAGSKFSANGAQLTVNLVGISGLGTYTPYAPSLGQRFQIVTAQGGLDGTTFGTFLQPAGLKAGTRLRALYGANGIDLLVVPTAYLALAQAQGANLNTQSVASALDVMAAAQDAGTATAAQNTLVNTVGGLGDAALPGTMRSLSGEIHGAVAAALPSAGQRLQDAVSRHVSALETRQRGLWVDYSGGGSRWAADSASSSARTRDRHQITIGFDVINDGTTGFGVALSQSNQKLSSSSGGNGEVKDTLGMAYGQLGLGAGLILDGQIGVGGGKALSSRDDPLAAFGLSQGQLKTDASTRQAFAGLGVRTAMNYENVRLVPYARVETQRVKREAAVEDSGSLAALNLGKLTAGGGRMELGVGVGSPDKDPGTSRFTFGGRLAVGRESGALRRVLVDARLVGAAIQIQAPRVSRQYLRAELTGTWLVMPGGYVYLGVSGLTRENRTDSSVTLGAVATF